MRNAVISSDAAAQAAAQEVLSQGGTAADAVLAGLFAGAARASSASLLGAGRVLVAGAGVGAFVVDGRARAPGKGDRRKSVPVDPPAAWAGAVPGLLEGALAAHVRFGTVALGTLTRAAVSAVKEHEESKEVRARLALLEALPRNGLGALERLGLLPALLEHAGPAAGGVFTRDDFTPEAAKIHPLEAQLAGDDLEVLRVAVEAPVKNPPPAPVAPPTGAVLAADMHGVVACAEWAVAPEAFPLATETGLAVAALGRAPQKGVTRWRAGAALPLASGAAVLRSAGRAWAGLVALGEGDREGTCDALLRARLALAGVSSYEGRRGGAPAGSFRGASLWAVREGDDVRTYTEGGLAAAEKSDALAARGAAHTPKNSEESAKKSEGAPKASGEAV